METTAGNINYSANDISYKSLLDYSAMNGYHKLS